LAAVEEPAQVAGAALSKGQLETAEAAARSCGGTTDERARARCALVLGRVLFARNEPAAAAQALSEARGKLGLLDAHAAVLLGEALLLSGAPAAAIPPLREAESLARERPPGLRASALLADALHATGDEAAALAQAEAAAALPGQGAQTKAGLALTRTEALASLARSIAASAPVAEAGKEGRGEPDPVAKARGAATRALLAERAFWLEHPDHPAAALVPRIEAELAGLAGAALPAASGHDLGLRASRLLAAGLPAAAVAQAREARRLLSGAEGAEVDLLLARALAADGRRAEATEPTERAWKAGVAHVAAASGLLLARDRARHGQPDQAVPLLDEIVQRFPGTPEADEAAYLAARLLLEEGSAGPGRRRLLRLAAHNRGPHASDARWTLAWLSFKAHRRDAAALFGAFAAGASDDASRAQGLYWQARTSKPAAAAPLLDRARSLDPLGWYGLLAAQHPSKVVPPFPPARPAAAAPLPQRLAIADELLGLGFRAEAAAELDQFVRQRHGRLADLLPALAAYERAGRFDRSVVLAQNLLAAHPPPPGFSEPGGAAQGAPDPGLRALLDAAYPAAYPDQIARSAERAGLDPYFVLAVVRRESVFRQDARSAAGAVGLLQFTPATARRAAAVLGRPAPRDDELFEPGTAIDLGSWYLSELVGRFGDAAVAAAAYNAGPAAAAPWAVHGAGERLDEWVEDIPFRETRQYVKAVLGAWSAYRILAGGVPPALASTVPDVKRGAEF
jgi:soluble lytic murein transglycosylase